MESWGLRLRKVCVECYGQDQVLVLSCVRFVCSELMGMAVLAVSSGEYLFGVVII